MATTSTWDEPDRCPFCGGAIASPGAGFVAHLDRAPECRSSFETWRDNVAGDVAAGWSG